MELDLVVGVHSIREIIQKKSREEIRLVATQEGIDEFKKKCPIKDLDVRIVSGHELQEEAKFFYLDQELEFQRVPSQIMAYVTPVKIYDPSWVYEQLESRIPLKLLALDQVTDIHNGAAIMRTAAFYGIDAIVISMKGNFGMGPSFTRIASGATEHVKVVKASSLTKIITKMKELGVRCIGLSEHATVKDLKSEKHLSTCLVLGAEDVGMSHAVSRVVDETIALESMGEIKSLNVSVASAIAMEKIFSK